MPGETVNDIFVPRIPGAESRNQSGTDERNVHHLVIVERVR